jgi:hypothetical protein
MAAVATVAAADITNIGVVVAVALVVVAYCVRLQFFLAAVVVDVDAVYFDDS